MALPSTVCFSPFLSTPSARRATLEPQHTALGVIDFYPRPPRGGRRAATGIKEVRHIFLSTPSARRATLAEQAQRVRISISIHALREEGDSGPPSNSSRQTSFLSTPSARRATAQRRLLGQRGGISIHALREEGDRLAEGDGCRGALFLSTPSARRATYDGSMVLADHEFLSTPSARRATHELDHGQRAQVISIHALREEGDDLRHKGRARGSNFYPRPPRGGRRGSSPAMDGPLVFLSTPSARRATRVVAGACLSLDISIHALREEGDIPPSGGATIVEKISIHALREEGDDVLLGVLEASGISIHALREEGDLASLVGK